MTTLHWLDFEVSEGSDGSVTLDALADVWPDQVAAVQAEVAAVQAWLQATFPSGHGPLEDGGEWLDDLQRHAEGGREVISWTLSATAVVADAFIRHWGVPSA